MKMISDFNAFIVFFLLFSDLKMSNIYVQEPPCEGKVDSPVILAIKKNIHIDATEAFS